uniref:Uncharacterized protein n=1 Tax=Anguilla anguilla TaxID=7936 RepID=A0A0E9QZB3_ANGAN
MFNQSTISDQSARTAVLQEQSQ